MNTLLLEELARIKIAEAQAEAERQRRIRQATGHGRPAIDMARLAMRARAALARFRSARRQPARASA
jgi:hypothetical protein